jgi:hypothetical protein
MANIASTGGRVHHLSLKQQDNKKARQTKYIYRYTEVVSIGSQRCRGELTFISW